MNNNKLTGKLFGNGSEIVLVISMIGILLVLFTPIPPALLDFLLVANFSFGLLILLLTLYTDSPLAFSTFPSLLLIATLFRLALNIAATRLILSDGDAGAVIGAVGSYVVGGNYVIGLVVFFILIVVQYVVVTSGSQRVAEVAARFTLDSMPGKQMSIDADLNMGVIDEEEAQKRRKDIEKEANFYGSMDGASKFVKGDAIAGIVIILIDIIGGLTVGVAQLGMSWSEALQTYTLLTVGDGIATQIPALVIATATGIIVTRAATDGEFGKEISSQITRYPQSLVMLSVALLGFLLLPGIPVFPVLTILLLVGVLLFIGLRRADSNAVIENDSGSISSEPESDDIYQKIEIQPIEIHLSDQVSDSFGENNSIVAEKIKAFRTQLAYELGFVLPNVDIVQNGACPQSGYEIRLYGSKVAEGVVYPEHYLAISANELNSLDGIATKDPTYGLPALWVTDEVRDKASSMGCTIVDATTVMVTHITEVLRNNIHEMLTRDVTEKLVSRIKNSQPGLYDELIPGILSITDIQKVLQRLLSEKVSIRNMEHILEVLLDSGRQGKSTDELVENVRQRLARVICEPLLADNLTLNVLTFDPLLEQKLQQGLRVGENSTTLQIDPMLTESVLKGVGREMEKMMGQSLKPVLLCSPSLRSHIKKVTERVYPYLNVISLTEIPKSVSINSFSVVMSDRGSIDNKRQEVVA